MRDSILTYFENCLPPEIKDLLQDRLADVESGKYATILSLPITRILLGHDQDATTSKADFETIPDWNDFIFHRLGLLFANRAGETQNIAESPAYKQHLLFLVAFAALQSFVQSNISGPPLPFVSSDLVFLPSISSNLSEVKRVRSGLVSSLGVDGIAAYKLTPNIELLCLAETILINPAIKKYVKPATWLQIRVDFLHQRLLSETSSTLQTSTYEGLAVVDSFFFSNENPSFANNDFRAQWLLEKATIDAHYGLDKKARSNIDAAATQRNFEFVLTGRLGKKTKYQDKDISQLVVLAKSADSSSLTQPKPIESMQPKTLDLNDDTLLESISFSPHSNTLTPADVSQIPVSLSNLEAGNQPQLHPIDAIILLSIASVAASNSPNDDIIREQTLPYALRVLEGGSSNWQVYTQALLVRSRIEGYRSRTMERGLLQLQTLVDQVIAETSSLSPQVNKSDVDSAPVQERLQYIYQFLSPTRWELEAELAARWVSLGGMRSALEIYERLEMWAEAALCWAVVERDDKARRLIRKLLFHATAGNDEDVDQDAEKWEGKPRDPQPADAPRLYCILGDLDSDPEMYELAWNVSNKRYARAQRSLGRHYYSKRDYTNSAAAYAQALSINGLNHATWFAYGCTLLELAEFPTAVEAFSRTVQLDDGDAEAWSNLAAALLRRGPRPSTETPEPTPAIPPIDPDAPTTTTSSTTEPPPASKAHLRDALTALKHAARLKHESYRIWENILTVAAALTPPSYADIVTAQARIVALRGAIDGEKCVDAPALALVVQHVVASGNPPAALRRGASGATDGDGDAGGDAAIGAGPRHGLAAQLGTLLAAVAALLTHSPPLYRLLGLHAEWLGRPSSALSFAEKGWRATTAVPGWESGTDGAAWAAVAAETAALMEAYARLGPRERTEGLGAGAGEVVARDWRFKARMAGKGVLGRARAAWEGSAEWDVLKARVEDLSGR